MSEPFVFDSRCPDCKTPYGAVPCGETVTLRVRPLAAEGFTHCALCLSREFAASQQELPLSPDGWDGDRVRFVLSFSAPAEPELVWYRFRLWREDGSGCFLDRAGYRSDAKSDPWQLTVYRPDAAPDWFSSGLVYQIFPDRFCRLTAPSAQGCPGERLLHQNWDDTPVWRPDADGQFRCRDFFGGTLAGIRAKLDDLAALGVTTLYLCPIFESVSNHRYDTADYLRIDPMLGTEADFCALCDDLHRRGMRLILDGVFNHTGSDSRYFNACGRYPQTGAAQSRESPYFPWYRFSRWPQEYECWWGIRTLPAVDEENPGYRRFIFGGADSVVRRWLRLGADGWRLDVADELPDRFLDDLRAAVDTEKPGALLLGEVWEDGTTKIAYSQRRRYLLGGQFHALMNYPFRTAALAYLLGGAAEAFQEAMETLREHYPPAAFASAMNFLGTHDTPRLLTVLGAARTPETKDDRAAYRLSPEEYGRGAALVKLGALLLFAFPGCPTVFYGDEAGMQGFEDPLNRGAYPWGREDAALLAWYRRLGALRRERTALQTGALQWLYAAGPGLAFVRRAPGETLTAVLNAGDAPLRLTLPWVGRAGRDLLSGALFPGAGDSLPLTLPPRSGLLLETAAC